MSGDRCPDCHADWDSGEHWHVDGCPRLRIDRDMELELEHALRYGNLIKVRELFRERIPVAKVRKMLVEVFRTGYSPTWTTASDEADAILREHGYGGNNG